MREIKFRAWVNNQMWDVEKLYRNGGMEISKDGHGFVFNQKTNIPIMQFTGLYDKNGKEIFEGDVVELGNYMDSFVVKWSVPDISFEVYDPRGQSSHSLTDYAFSYIEVLGNIYENPELLEVEE